MFDSTTILLVQLIFFLLLSLGVWYIATSIVILPKKTRYTQVGASRKQRDLLADISAPLAAIIEGAIFISPYKRESMVSVLEQAEIDLTPEQYEAQSWAKIIIVLALCLVFAFFNTGIAIGVALIGMGLYDKSKGDLSKRILRRREEIEEELPSFCRFFLSASRNQPKVKVIIEKYLSSSTSYNANSTLRMELKRCLDEMSTSSTQGDSEEIALQRLAERAGVRKLDDLIKGMIRMNKGEDQTSYFQLVERDMNELAHKYLQRKRDEIPRMLAVPRWVAVGCAVALIFVPFLMMIGDKLQDIMG